MSTHRLKYAYQWAKDPVSSFVEKYARGTYNLSKLVNLAPGLVRHYCCLTIARGNSLKWEALKRVIIALEDYSADDIKAMPDYARELLYKNLVYLAENDEIDFRIARKAIDNLDKKSEDLEGHK